jgi:transcription antitermination protein NusB
MADPNPDDLLEQLRRAIPAGAFLDRRLGRALAFQALYEMDVAHHQPDRSVERLGHAESPGGYTPETLAAATAYAQTLIGGVLDHRPQIDALIHERAPLWPLAQMSAIDRNVLRIGLYESLYGETSVPLRAAINEAVELAKAFGSETSAKFVNGVLGRAVETSTAETGPEPTPEDRIAPDHGVGHNAPAMSETERTANTEDNAGAERAPDRPAEERGLDDGREL